MEIRVHEWLNEEQSRQWLCPHINALISHLHKTGGTTIKAVGLINYRSPEAVIFLSDPINEDSALQFTQSNKSLEPQFNGAGKLSSIRCAKHPVCITYTSNPE